MLSTLSLPSQDEDFLEFCDELLMDGLADSDVGGEECGGGRKGKGSLVVQAADGGGVRVLGAVLGAAARSTARARVAAGNPGAAPSSVALSPCHAGCHADAPSAHAL